MTVTLLRGNALALPLADDSVDLVVTSPPYFGLRSYTDGGEHYADQLGSEPTPHEFVDSLIAATREMARVTKPTGSIFVNLGDKYSTYESRPGKAATHDWAAKSQQSERYTRSAPERYGVPYKSLMGLPWRFALRCIDELGLTLRAEIIWAKPNGMPESVTDRVRRNHEHWFHLTMSQRYFQGVDELREPHLTDKPARPLGTRNKTQYHDAATDNTGWKDHAVDSHPLGKLPGSVWEIATQPLRVPASLGVAHFAAFPMEWPRRIIKGWAPYGICSECGQGRRPAVERKPMEWTPSPTIAGRSAPDASRVTVSGTMQSPAETRIVGQACGCDAPTAPAREAVVLDPFGGTGTTALVAHALGRHGISVDMSSDYCRLAAWRTTDRAQLAKARGVKRTAAEKRRDDAAAEWDAFVAATG